MKPKNTQHTTSTWEEDESNFFLLLLLLPSLHLIRFPFVNFYTFFLLLILLSLLFWISWAHTTCFRFSSFIHLRIGRSFVEMSLLMCSRHTTSRKKCADICTSRKFSFLMMIKSIFFFTERKKTLRNFTRLCWALTSNNLIRTDTSSVQVKFNYQNEKSDITWILLMTQSKKNSDYRRAKLSLTHSFYMCNTYNTISESGRKKRRWSMTKWNAHYQQLIGGMCCVRNSEEERTTTCLYCKTNARLMWWWGRASVRKQQMKWK